ncbi:hypothetical protein [Lentzea aerocolonigenes]|nr:hypothetical protein [Lentzea aerocolonigenes]
MAARPVDDKTWLDGTRNEQVRREGGPVLASVVLERAARATC